MKARLFASVAAGLMAVSSFSALAAQQLHVGTHPAFAPFEFMDTKTRQYVGFDLELIEALSKRAGYDFKLVTIGFDGLIPALLTGSIDLAAAGITITEERKKKVDFCDPYYQAGQGLMVREGTQNKFIDLHSLQNKTIAVELGTTGAELAKTIPNAKIKAFDTGADAFMELRMKGADAVIMDRPVVDYFMVKNPRAARGLVHQKVVFDSEYFGFAVKKGNDTVRTRINDALYAMKADGSYQKIYAKWFGKQ